MKEDKSEDRRRVELFLQSIQIGEPDKMDLEGKVDVLRGCCFFLLTQLQKTYMYIERHSNGHDSFLHKDIAYVMGQSEDVLTMFFPDFLGVEIEQEEEEEKGAERKDDDDEPDSN